MKHILKRLKVDRWIAEGAPVFWVLGISSVLCGAALGILSAVFLILDWRFLAVVISWVFGALTACFGVCVVWFVVDALTARERPKPWEIGRPFADGQEHRDRPRQNACARSRTRAQPYAHHLRPNHARNRAGQARAFYVASSGAGRRLA
jgi:hypothetical protein